MRDLRIPVFPSQVLSIDATAYNGQTIDLMADYANGNHRVGTSLYGLGGTIMLKTVVTGTGDGFTVTAKSQISSDGTTFTDHETIGVFTMDTDGNFMIDSTTAGTFNVISTIQTRQKMDFRIRTALRYCRIVLTTASITNGESVVASAWIADGTPPFGDSGRVY